MVTLPRALYDQLIAHVRREAPYEACGIVGLQGERVVRLEPARNAAATRQVRFTFDDDGYRKIVQIEREGLEIGIFHSHPASPAYPSPTDRHDMRHTWPGSLQLMVSLRHGATTDPEVNAYRIDEAGNVTQVPLSIED